MKVEGLVNSGAEWRNFQVHHRSVMQSGKCI